MKGLALILIFFLTGFQLASANCDLCCAGGSDYSKELSNLPPCHRTMISKTAGKPHIKEKKCTIINFENNLVDHDYQWNVKAVDLGPIVVSTASSFIIELPRLAQFNDFRHHQRFRDRLRLHQLQEKFLN